MTFKTFFRGLAMFTIACLIYLTLTAGVAWLYVAIGQPTP